MEGSEPHPITRARERYGVSLTVSDLKIMELKIIAGKSLLIRRYSNTETHVVKFNGVGMTTVWLRGKQVILTFLPKEGLHSDGQTYFRPKKTMPRWEQEEDWNPRTKRVNLPRDGYTITPQPQVPPASNSSLGGD